MVYLHQIWHYYTFKNCQATGMQKSDNALLSIISAGQSLLVKMFTTLKPHGIFGLAFAYLNIWTRHWNARHFSDLYILAFLECTY